MLHLHETKKQDKKKVLTERMYAVVPYGFPFLFFVCLLVFTFFFADGCLNCGEKVICLHYTLITTSIYQFLICHIFVCCCLFTNFNLFIFICHDNFFLFPQCFFFTPKTKQRKTLTLFLFILLFPISSKFPIFSFLFKTNTNCSQFFFFLLLLLFYTITKR